MKRRSIAVVLFFSFLLNVAYCVMVAFAIFYQATFKEKAGASPEAVAQFSIPVTYILFALITLLMQLVLIINFNNSMRFEHPTIWVEVVSAILYGGVFRIFYHYIPALEGRMVGSIVGPALESREILNRTIQYFDFIYALASAFFLVGVGMTICFKKMIRYWLNDKA
ncbi:MAG: hypothetical protein J6125_02420 [Clostridia bacterium]|nr:hypothetical protein [Clostridia bacterium]